MRREEKVKFPTLPFGISSILIMVHFQSLPCASKVGKNHYTRIVLLVGDYLEFHVGTISSFDEHFIFT